MTPRAALYARLLAWLALMGLLGAGAWARLDRAQPVDTDLLHLLPAQQQSPLLAAATERTQDAFLRELLIVVSGADAERTRAAAQAAYAAVKSAGLNPQAVSGNLQALLDLYSQHHFALLTPEDAARLMHDPASAFTAEVAGQLANPAGMLGDPSSDPGGYLARYVGALPQPYPGFLPDGDLFTMQKDGRSYFLVRALQSESVFGESGVVRSVKALNAARNAANAACADCRVQATGAALFADAARRESQREVFWLTLISTVFIMVLIWAVFSSLRPHLLGFLCIGASVLAACAAVIACFGQIHLLTFVGGTTLLGIAIDYAFLYFAAHWFGRETPAETLKIVLPGLTLGLITALVAFSFLLFSGFPALVQIAVFSDAGLLGAYATVVLLFPPLLRKKPTREWRRPFGWPQDFVAWARRPGRRRLAAPLLLLLLTAPGLFWLQGGDDVRELQHFPQALLDNDAAVRKLLGQEQPPGFFLIEGRDLDQALEREQALFTALRAAHPDAVPLGLSDFVPSQARQQANLDAWKTLFAQPAKLQQAITRLGLPASFARQIVSGWQRASHEPLPAQAALHAAPDLGQFLFEAGGGAALIATVDLSPEQVPALTELAAKTQGVSFVAPLDRIAARFREIRARAAWLVVAGYLLISVLLLARYGRRDALRMLYPPLLALAVTLGVLGWLHEPLNIFVVVALILVLGLGRDYTVFLKESGSNERGTALAVALSALATLCGFGLLVFSRIPALHAFGLTALIGILVSYLCAPLSLPPSEDSQS